MQIVFRQIRSLLAHCGVILLGHLSLAITPVQAVIIATTNNAEVISPNFGFTNVGARSNGQASFTYIGNGWALTAGHVNTTVGNPVFNNTSYSISQSVYLHNLEATPNTPQYDADLKLVKLSGPANPNLPNLDIPLAHLTVDTGTVLAGNGTTRGSLDLVDGGQGYQELNPSVLKYGENTISFVLPGLTNEGVTNEDNNGNFYSHLVATTFDRPPSLGGTAYTDEAQASLGDSGGGAFQQVAPSATSPGQLQGIMVLADAYQFAPNGPIYAMFNDQNHQSATFIVDLSYYRSQIVSITGVPEPSSLILGLLGGAALLVAGWSRHQKNAGRRRAD